MCDLKTRSGGRRVDESLVSLPDTAREAVKSLYDFFKNRRVADDLGRQEGSQHPPLLPPA